MKWFQRRIKKAQVDERVQFYSYKAGYNAFQWVMVVILGTALLAGALKSNAAIISMIGMWLAVFGGTGVFVYNQKKYEVVESQEEMTVRSLEKNKLHRGFLIWFIAVVLIVPLPFQYMWETLIEHKEWVWAEGIWESATFSFILLAVFGGRIGALVAGAAEMVTHAKEDMCGMITRNTRTALKKLIFFDSIGNAAFAYMIAASNAATDRILEGYQVLEFPTLVAVLPLVIAVNVFAVTVLWRMRKLERGTLDVDYYFRLTGKMYNVKQQIHSVLLGLGTAFNVLPLLEGGSSSYAIAGAVGISCYVITRYIMVTYFGKAAPVL